jgi:tetratricopeptide (TPR) repeat protein
VVLGELDWIAMKCLEKDRNRRYESPSALAADVERHLRHEPVQACPPSNWYRFHKLTRRNRTACVAAGAAVLVVLLGTAALAISNYLIRQEQARTRDEQHRTAQALRLAQERAEEIQQGLERLKQANTLLERGRWDSHLRHWSDAHDAFTRAVQLRDDHVAVWVERAELYTRLGLWDLAAADYARELELREPDTTFRWFQHALLRRAVGDEEGCLQTARAMRQRFSGTPDEAFIEEMLRCSLLVPDSDADLRQLIEVAREAAPVQPYSINFVVGHAEYRAGRYDEAIQTLVGALARPHWPIGEASYPVLAMAHYRLGHDADARQALGEAARHLDHWTQERYAGQRDNWVIDYGASGFWPVGWWDYVECQLLYREARLLIDGAPPPDDPRLHVLRARALAALHWCEQAIAEYDTALRLNPHDAQVQAESHRCRGRCCADRRQWREAAAEFGAAAQMRPDDTYLARFQAVAHFAAGDVDAYRHVCATMLDRFAHTQDHATAGNVLLVCVLRDDAVSDMGRLLPLTPVPLGHWGDWARGAALYRAGRYEESIECFETAANKFRPRALDWCFLAMAHHRLGHADDARRCLAEARRWIDAANHDTGDDLSATRPAWGSWHEPVVYPLLLREAEELLGQESVNNPRQPEAQARD